VFTTDRAPVPEARVLAVLREEADVVRARLDAGTALLG
jgi:hypothetical protein